MKISVDDFKVLEGLKQYHQADSSVASLITEVIKKAMEKQAEMLEQKLSGLIAQEQRRHGTLIPGEVREKFMPQAKEAIHAGMISESAVKEMIDRVCVEKIGRRNNMQPRYSQDFFEPDVAPRRVPRRLPIAYRPQPILQAGNHNTN